MRFAQWQWLRLMMWAVVAVALSTQQSCAPPDDQPPLQTACGQFAAECVTLVGQTPLALAGIDLDNDGDLDLVTTNFTTDNIDVWFNDGQSHFSSGGVYSVPAGPRILVAGDWDQDGFVDIAVQNATGVATSFNSGSIHLFPSLELLDINSTQALATMDVDSDGDLDLIAGAGQTVTDQIHILRNYDTGHFFDEGTIAIGDDDAGIAGLCVKDLNNDGSPDVTVAGKFSGKVTVLTNVNQGESFDISLVIPLGTNHVLNAITGGDLNDDGFIDLVVADAGDSTDPSDRGAIVILINDGQGGFEAPFRVSAGTNPAIMAVAEFNNDGHPDIAVANSISNDVSLLINQGNGRFAPAKNYGVGKRPSCIIAKDLDDDGNTDLAVTCMDSNSVVILLNDGTGNFEP